ncbi:MAG: extracellular solute-binding protein [Planctomycetota bacterium]
MVLGSGTGCVPRGERDVVVYSALDEDFAFPILSAFERANDQETGVIAKFDIESTKTVGLVEQIISEAESPRCDVFWNNEILHTVRLQKLGLLEPHSWKLPTNWPANLIASDGTWCGFAARARVILVNTDRLPDATQWPTSVDELAESKWRSDCAMARPLFGTTATHFAVLRELRTRPTTLEFLRLIASNAIIESGNKQVARSVSAGRVAWGLTDTDDAFIEMELGYPVEIIFPDQEPHQLGALRIPNTLAILKGSPHPVAAGNLVDFLMTPETEDRLAMGRSSQIPIHPDTKFPPPVLPEHPVRWMRADFEASADGWRDWATTLADIFAR